MQNNVSKLTVEDLVNLFQTSEEATMTAREKAERDRDYVDGIQYTAEQISELNKRRQPVVTDNRIKPKIDFIVGIEKQSRIDPRALPRTPVHEEDADGATQALRSVTDKEDYDTKRSAVWRNMLVEGAGGIRVYVEPSKSKYGAFEIRIDHIAWDRMFWDPHSSRPDFSDAAYLGVVVWMDYDDAVAKYPDGVEFLDATMASESQTQTYDDKPHFTSWADKKRKRVRIVQIWIRRNDEWHFAEYTRGGILKAGRSPYVTDSGESDCELFFQSAFINRENERYGYVREMVSPQDEINKRRSKTLHALNTRQVIYTKGAVNDIEAARREAARPDGVIEVNPLHNLGVDSVFKIESQQDVAEGNFKLLVEAQNAIDLKGPNATMLGDKAQGSASASGRAIIASQQGGMVSLADLTDNLRQLDLKVFRAIWNRIRQFWTAETWVRITDDERNVKWVALNAHPARVQMIAANRPEMAEKISGAVRSVAELDCDIVIDEAPDNLTPQLEQFQSLVELKKYDAKGEIPFRAIVEAIPNLKNRQRFLQSMDEAAQQPQAPPPQVVAAQLDAQIKQQEAELDAQIKMQSAQVDNEIAMRKAANEIEIAQYKARASAERAAVNGAAA